MNPRLSDGADARLARLVRAGRAEAPSAEAKERALAAALSMTAAGAASGLALRLGPTATKLFGAALVVSAVAGGPLVARWLHRPSHASRAPVPAFAAPAHADAPAAPPATAASAPNMASPATAASAPNMASPASTIERVAPIAPIESIAPTNPVARLEVPAVRGPTPPEDPTRSSDPLRRPRPRTRAATPSTSLASELDALRNVKRAVDRRDGARAQVLLDRYAAAFPDARLEEEAMVLRVEALVLTHDAARARAAGDTFAQRYPRSAYGARVSTVLATLAPAE
jgi:hypothetical protein